MLQYALLHLFGYALTMDDLKNFRVSALAKHGLFYAACATPKARVSY